MLLTVAILIASLAVAGCCVYVGYRIGQSVSPTSRLLEERMAQLEVAIGRSKMDVRDTFERNREESGKEAKRLLEDGARLSEANAQVFRRALDDFAERLNGMRLDLARDSDDFRESVQRSLAALQDGKQDDVAELRRIQSETFETLSGLIRELGSDSERRHASDKTSLEDIGSQLSAAYATGLAGLRGEMTSQLAEVREAVPQLRHAIAGQNAQFDTVDQGLRAALQDLARRHDALNGAIETQLGTLQTRAAEQLAQLSSVGERLDGSRERSKGDLEAMAASLVQIGRAVEALKNELTVKVHDPGATVDVHELLERFLQPNEFERDVEIEPGTSQRVGFAVRLSDNPLTRVWLPIGVLSATDGYHGLLAATVYKDADGIRSSSEVLERAVVATAEELSAKFVCPPHTINLAVLFAPTEDLFAEIARRDSLIDAMRRNLHVMVAGPATLPTLLTGLRMAFRGTSRLPTLGAANGRLGRTT